jgi:uncharacterized membrane protein YeiH
VPGGVGAFAEALGVAVFALTGALVAARRGMDPFGFALLATVTGIGGGTARDLLLGAHPVFWVAEPRDVIICLFIAGAIFALGPARVARLEGNAQGRALVWTDALGLALFAVVGTERALAAGASILPAIELGTITATFGGIIRDLLAGTIPLVLRREIYVTAAALGAAVVAAAHAAGLAVGLAAALGFAAAFALRALAILRGWSLPAFPRREE